MTHPFAHFRSLNGTWVVSVIEKSGDEQVVASTVDPVEAYEALDDVLLLERTPAFASVSLTCMINTG